MQGGSPAEFDDALLRLPRRRRQEQPEFSAQAATGIAGTSRKLALPTEDLRKAWAVSRRISKDDWLEWYNGLCREFLKVSIHFCLYDNFSKVELTRPNAPAF